MTGAREPTSRAAVGSSAMINFGIPGQRPGDGHALALSAGELVDQLTGVVAQAEGAEYVVAPLGDL